MIKSEHIRKQFLDFFEQKKHKIVRSASVVPINDSTLLFTNAGMNQFKPFFLGNEIPSNRKIVNSQKCIRVSGKHNDLEEVGVDDYHHTFFEMLGNWSFGDYYKKEAITWAWELITEIWKIDKNRLWVSVYEDDIESRRIWIEETDINPDRIINFDKKENFWEMGKTGPCGPCTEIHYYNGKDIKKQNSSGVNIDSEYREFWNLVFMQYNRDGNGKLHDLPEKHVDTGLGLERVVGILNNQNSNYDTDLFRIIIRDIEKLSKVKYNKTESGTPHRVIADHIRMLSFAIADGVMPSNEGKGYVLRRVLRRASRFGRKIGMKNEFLYKLVDSVIKTMGSFYPELIEKRSHIMKVIQLEEESFGKTIDRGIDTFNNIINKLDNSKQISGKDAFKLYDTYGFPLDLTTLMASEINIEVDQDEFIKCMELQKNRSKLNKIFESTSDEITWIIDKNNLNSEFIGYDIYESKSQIINYRLLTDKNYQVVLDKTPFYAESGGQIGDKGTFEGKDFIFKVFDTQNINSKIIHIGKVEKGKIDLNININAKIDIERRKKIMSNHTATHLLHEALKRVLGDHVQQTGSLVSDNKLRFDLTHYNKIIKSDINKIEILVNDAIRNNFKLSTELKSFDLAKKSGAVALFGEKYGDKVRVVTVPDFSMELCGGTHVLNTGEIGVFKIISESSLSSGVRRIEAITGQAVIDRMNSMNLLINNSKEILKTTEESIIEKIKIVLNLNKELKKKVNNLDIAKSNINLEEILSEKKIIKNIKIVLFNIEDTNVKLKEVGDQFRLKIKNNGLIILTQQIEDKMNIMCAMTDDLSQNLSANEIVKKIGKKIEGGGGGKKHMATAGGKNILSSSELLDFSKKLLEKII
jgi:alanyl-tRNA synthetase